MGKIDSIKSTMARWLRSCPFWVLVALIIGFLIFNAFIAGPKVGIIKISDISLDPWDAPKVVQMIKYAEETDAIKAVVIEIDCTGGGAVSTEEVYLNILRLREKKPVVAYINLWSLSGGYYIAVASNFIYAKPTSQVGSVGVWVSLPPEQEKLYEDVMGSGPHKTVTPRRDVVNWLEMVKESFLTVVISQRGDRLKISKEELSKAAIYIGMEALRHGLIDDIGSSSDAVKKAAELAGIKRYGRVDINKELDLLPPWYEQVWAFEDRASLEPKTLKSPADRLPMFYYLHEAPR